MRLGWVLAPVCYKMIIHITIGLQRDCYVRWRVSWRVSRTLGRQQRQQCATSVVSIMAADIGAIDGDEIDIDDEMSYDEATCSGEEIAASLYREHEQSLRTYVTRYVPGYERSHADDVIQETFVRTITHLNSGRTVDSPKGFLFTTARNLITSMFYRGRRHTHTDSHADMDEYALNANTCPEQRAIMRQKLDAFSDAIATLPKRYQEAFVRRRIWGESCREISVKMQLSESAVSNYAALGWKQLVNCCEERGINLDSFLEQE